MMNAHVLILRTKSNVFVISPSVSPVGKKPLAYWVPDKYLLLRMSRVQLYNQVFVITGLAAHEECEGYFSSHFGFWKLHEWRK